MPLQNLSIGASASTVGLYQSAAIRPARNGFALFDYAINDNDAGYNLWGLARAPAVIATTFHTLAALVAAAGYFPIVLILPSDLSKAEDFFGEAVHRDICLRLGLNYLSVRTLVLRAIAAGVPTATLMRDEWHMSDAVADLLAGLLAGIIATLDRARPVLTARREKVQALRTVPAPHLFQENRIGALASSLRQASYGLLAAGMRIEVALAEGERVGGIMVNGGGNGANLVLRGEREVVKRVNFEWSGYRPKPFFSVFVDLAEPLAGSSGTVTIELAGDDRLPTERTIHERPLNAEVPREVELEAVFITGPERDLDFVSRSYPGLPLDLGELGETERFYRALLGLRS
ncbi:MAG TPA: hypothetical protein VFB16_06330 [Bauldia sp.]|nr:hypothetical protein [Bauldia sp.]